LITVSSSDEMYEAVHRCLPQADVVVMCAAVADYKPANVSATKIKKSEAALSLKLVPTRDILASIAHPHRPFLVVGFAAETNDVEENARQKLRAKDCDVIVANDVSDPKIGMESDENEVTIFARDGQKQKISRAPKKIVAQEVIKIISKMREKCLTKNIS
jgi:phosphopantothenoylcysteine decarboxylase/phosphopantothenate--cysteine ligase